MWRGFRSERRFDVIDAEGFIYTIQPFQTWLRVFHQLLYPDGSCHHFLSSTSQAWLLRTQLQAIHAAGKALTGARSARDREAYLQIPNGTASRTRALSSHGLWTCWKIRLSATEPSSRQANCARSANRLEFDLHASWPSYRDSARHLLAQEDP